MSGTQTGSDGTLRVGVVGVGVMGSNHARVLSEMPGVKLVGIADPDGARCDLVAERLGCAVFKDVQALLNAGVDAVTIAAPTHLHRDIALDCTARGVHIMVEKPIAPTVEEGRAIVAAARRAGVTLMVGHVERFNPAVSRSSARSRIRTFSRSPSPASARFRRACPMSVSSSTSPCTIST